MEQHSKDDKNLVEPQQKIEITVENLKNNEAECSANNEASSADPLNQAQLSLMTDDNSTLELDQSDINLKYSDEDEPENVKVSDTNEKNSEEGIEKGENLFY